MTTKVHDQDDQDFAEIDIILAQAKRELRRDRKLRRNMNLSDIPENSALVPSSEPNTRPISLDTSQPDCASRDHATNRSQPKLYIFGTMAPIKWMRAYMGCLMAVREGPDFAAHSPSRQQRRDGS